MTFFEGVECLQLQAIFLGQRLDLRSFAESNRLSSNPLTMALGPSSVAVLFRYGVAVLVSVQAEQSRQFLDGIAGLVVEPFTNPESDTIELIVSPDLPEGIEQGRVRLQNFDLQRIQVVADVLAKSVVLAYYEVTLAKHFDRIEPLAANLSTRWAMRINSRALLQDISTTLVIESKMTGRVEASEKPELLWEFPEHERLYLRLEGEYELTERNLALERKLALLARTAGTLLGILQNQRSLRVEWYIVFLILIEIVITLLEKTTGS